MRLLLIIPFFSICLLSSCMQSDNSHSSDKSRNDTIQQMEELNEIMERIDNGDTSVELTISQKAYAVIEPNCMNCHHHRDWQIEDSYWLQDTSYNYYISPHSSRPEDSRSARIIDRLAIHGTGSIWDSLGATMPQNGTLSEEDFIKLDDWVQYLIEEKNK